MSWTRELDQLLIEKMTKTLDGKLRRFQKLSQHFPFSAKEIRNRWDMHLKSNFKQDKDQRLLYQWQKSHEENGKREIRIIQNRFCVVPTPLPKHTFDPSGPTEVSSLMIHKRVFEEHFQNQRLLQKSNTDLHRQLQKQKSLPTLPHESSKLADHLLLEAYFTYGPQWERIGGLFRQSNRWTGEQCRERLEQLFSTASQ